MSDPPRRRMVRPPAGEAARRLARKPDSKKARSPSSRAWLERQINDPFAAQARALGLRSRAALKLEALDKRHRLLAGRRRALDLGCAPGGWLQVLASRGIERVVGVDLLEVEPLAGATIVQGDYLEESTRDRLLQALGGPPDLVLSDMAPNTTGHRRTDHLRIMVLAEAAADLTLAELAEGGHFVCKVFQGGESETLARRLAGRFAAVRWAKPPASRAESAEAYLVGRDFRRR